MFNSLTFSRILLVCGFLVGVNSLAATFSHISDPAYLLNAGFGGGRAHAQYHALREAFGDLAAMAAILIIFFGKPHYRSPLSWTLCLILMLGYYLPFWIGMPFKGELAAPGLGAELNHLFQAGLALSALFLARKSFFFRDNIDSPMG